MAGFVMLESYYEALRPLDDEMRWQMYDCIFDYVFQGKEPSGLSPILNGYFALIRPNIDASIKRYKASTENGKRGGRPKKTYKKPNENLEETKDAKEEKPSKNQEKDKDMDKELDKDSEYDNDTDEGFNPNTVEAYAASNIQYLSPNNMEELISFKDGLPDELIIHAIDKACEQGKRFYSYVKGILNGYLDDGIKTVGDAKAAEEKVKQQKGGGRNGARTNQRQDAVNRGDTPEKPKQTCPWEVIL